MNPHRSIHEESPESICPMDDDEENVGFGDGDLYVTEAIVPAPLYRLKARDRRLGKFRKVRRWFAAEPKQRPLDSRRDRAYCPGE